MIFFKLLIVASFVLASFHYPLLVIPLGIILILNYRKTGFKTLLIGSVVFLVIGLIVNLVDIKLEGNYLGLIIKSEEKYVVVQTIFGRYYYAVKGHNYATGDIISITGHSQHYHFSYVEKGFNFNEYLQNQAIKQEIIVSDSSIILRFPIRRLNFNNQYSRFYDENTATLVEALIFDKKNYENELISRFQSLDLLFLLSASGMHIYLLFNFLRWIMGMFSFKKLDIDLIPILLLIPLWLINLDKFIFYRVFIIKILHIINTNVLKSKYDYLSVVSISGILFLIICPTLIFNMSFYISYGLTLFIYFLRPLLTRLKKSSRTIVMAIMIYTFMIPIRIQQSNHLMPLVLPLQLTMAPVIGIFFILSYISIMMGGRGGVILNWYTNIILKLSGTFKYLDFTISAFETSVYGCLFVLMLFYLLIYCYEVKHRPYINLILCSLSIISLFTFSGIIPLFTESVTFINVGQGDATLIQTRNTSILIDTGGSHYIDIAKESLIPYFRSKQVNDIDVVIITHNDFDHNGALESLKSNFKIKRVIDHSNKFPLSLGGITLSNLNNDTFEEDNDNSLILFMDFMNKQWLFMGDASIKNEQRLIDKYPKLKVDVLKVGHHGSHTSTSLEFLHHIQPIDAVISAGMNNYYGHPHKTVLNNLEQKNIRVRRTDIEGTIVYKRYVF